MIGRSEKILHSSLKKKAANADTSKPVIFNLRRSKERRVFEKLLSTDKIQHVIDDYKEQLHELFAVKNPELVFNPVFTDKFAEFFSNLARNRPLWEYGRWVYYPWLSSAVHILEDHDFQSVRTARNRNLINAAEQEKFYNAVIGIGGLSVGNSVALTIALQGGGKHMRLADFDRLALSNTNRVRAGVQNLGLGKAEMTARQMYEINPYARIELFSDGLTEKNIKRFFAGPPKLNIMVDELDNIAMKYLIREYARRYRVPIVMAADNGDNGVVDIERYDLNPRTKFFHGRMGPVAYKKLLDLDKMGIGKLIVRHIGPETVTRRVQESMPQIGKTIVSWPQLGGAAVLNGSAVAYCVRKILNKQPLESNRALISLDEKLVPNYNSRSQKKSRLKSAHAFRKIFGL
ncbi:MAG: ThiF family adenylyltransferase [Candidatus Liptonbacteria bacterium]|nr:ThiF family adenylyltransferase [Candidatus Liptonbacteria bacterium]